MFYLIVKVEYMTFIDQRKFHRVCGLLGLFSFILQFLILTFNIKVIQLLDRVVLVNYAYNFVK